MRKDKLRPVLYILSFIIALQAAIPAYINSSFIEQYLSSEKLTGLLYTIASILTVAGLLLIPIFLKKIGNFTATLFISLLSGIALLILTFSHSLHFVLSSFIIYLILSSIIFFNLDIFLEQQSDDEHTGNIRGIHLSIINVAWVISPLIASLLLTNGDYWKIYLTASFLSVPFVFLLMLGGVRKFKDPSYKTPPFLRTFKKIKERKNVYKIFMVRFLLNFFYAWMVIYTPLYLHKYIGFDWQTIGIIFTIMLLPFILFELPLGNLADKKYGEKEILNTGIIIMALSTIMLSFLSTSTFWVWAIILFMTRAGASAIEIASESYFFKHVDAKEADIISFFRITSPLAYSLAPLAAFIILYFISFNLIFIVLGITILFGLRYGLTIKDTK
ncbi:MAG: MFS transporter [Patescibacteria group bacterium]|nr:MFS transporter [Patescibacteria group bacterium]